MAATVKAILQGSSLNVTNTEASATLRYYIDGVTATNSVTMETARQANGLPAIGSLYPQKIAGAPKGLAKQHSMYAMLHKVTPPGRNGTKWFVDVEFRSPPAPTIEFASGLVQKKSDLYLSEVEYPILDSVSAFWGRVFQRRMKQKQIQLTYYVPAGVIAGFSGAQNKRAPANVSRYFYSDSFRVSQTRFGDLDYGRALQMSITGCINSSPFQNYPSRTVLCTGCQLQSGDGGWSYRLIPEFLFNIDSWDALAVYQQSGENALLSEANVTAVTAYLIQANGTDLFPQGVPEPVAPTNGGAGRFPLYPAVNFAALISDLIEPGTGPQHYVPFDARLPSMF